MKKAFLRIIFYFALCCLCESVETFGLKETKYEKRSFCPPKSIIEPCECDEEFDHIKCFGKGQYNISDIFARISDSNYSHFYDFFTWRIYETEGVIPDHIFGDCAILDFEIQSSRDSFIREISPKAFVNYEGRNYRSTFVGLDIATVVPHQELINTICSQVSNVDTLYLALKYDVYEEPRQVFVREDFAACRNSKELKQATIKIIGDNRNVKYNLEPYFTDYLSNVVSLELDFPISVIKNYAFSRRQHKSEIEIIFEDLRIEDISPKAFLGMNATIQQISLNTWLVLVRFPEAFSNFFDEADNNIVEVYGDTKARMNCDCSIKWLFERRHRLRLHGASSIDMFTCKDGTNFFDLTEKAFVDC